ncbi:hypothetical protein ACFL41_02135 [Gemmatimonadota bacterium]
MALILICIPNLAFGQINPAATTASPIDNKYSDLLIEYEPVRTIGMKFLNGNGKGWFGGFKIVLGFPRGEEYNWDTSRAENFYNSDFQGYSKGSGVGLNGGYAISYSANKAVLYAGGGILWTSKYRQYYDSTFTDWSNDYHITDGAKESIKIDIIVGTYFRTSDNEFVIGLGYSTGSSTIAIGIGFPFGFNY